ncbi:hypothetical protein [Pseudolactococcus carnosus]|nr:hypothetical protein [Lactococcus carnosus]
MTGISRQALSILKSGKIKNPSFELVKK